MTLHDVGKRDGALFPAEDAVQGAFSKIKVFELAQMLQGSLSHVEGLGAAGASVHGQPPVLQRETVFTDYLRLRTKNFLQQRFGPVFQSFFYLVEELVGDGAVDHAMVVAQRDVAH